MSDRVVIDGDMSLTSTIDGEGGAYIRLGQNPVIEPLNVTENGTYEVPEGVDGFNPVRVDISKTGLTLYSSIQIEKYKGYGTFDDFKNAVVPDLPIDAGLILIDFVNNTSNSRAGVYWVQAKSFQKDGVVSGGKRVGGQFGGSYGCDVYAGATVNVYVLDY